MKKVLASSVLCFASVCWGQSLPVHDRDFECLNEATAQQYTKDFNIYEKSFGKRDLCDNSTDLKKLFNDMELIRLGRFSAQAPGNILIRDFVPEAQYYGWLKTQTRGVSRGNDIPYATAYNRGGYFTMQDGWAQLSTLGRVGVLIHEARHTAGYSHIPCVAGPYADARTAGCDRDYSYGGSHGVEMEYYSRVHVRGENFHPVYKTMARLMAMGRANFVFNKPVLKTKEALVAIQARDQRPIMFYQDKSWPRDVLSAPGALKRTSFGASIFDGRNAFAIEMYQPLGQSKSLVDVYSYFKLLDRKSANPLKDFEEFDLGYRRFAVKLSSENQVASYDFPSGRWSTDRTLGFSPVKTVTTLPSGERGYFLIDGKSQIYSYDPKKNVTVGPLEKTWDSQILKVAHDERGRTVYLRQDQTLWWDEAGQWSPYIEGSWSDLVTIPIYDAYEVSL